ncbi:MAG: signal peptidase I [Clostridia bacterium]|nr:signal peptidase I [Clostridia bacterium]
MIKPLSDSELYEFRHGDKERRSNARFLCVILSLFIAFLTFSAWWTGAFGGVVVDGSSMNQTLYDGETLLMKYAKRDEAKRGDIIVVYVGGYEECKSVKGDFLIKRLIAIEGDKVRCDNGQIEIMYAGTSEWTELSEPYAYYGNYRFEYDFAEYTVGENEIFFLGDNRSGKGSSVDSRYQEGMSHLEKLYQETDVYGIVPAWAIEHHEILSKIFFRR